MADKKALISVYEKQGIETFAAELVKLGFEILSSGGTAKYLADRDVAVTDVAEITGMPAMLDHRVVTLHPKVHGGLLALPTAPHDTDRMEHGIPWIDLVCVDLYPLQTAIMERKTEAQIIEMIDVGGPTMLSSGAKGRRIVVCDPSDRRRVLDWLIAGRPEDEDFRRYLAAKADFVVSAYRLLSAQHFGNGVFDGKVGTRVVECKGENGPQSPAGLYSVGTGDPLALDRFELLEGTPLSYNNWCDLDRALTVATAISNTQWKLYPKWTALALGIKHGNPCGAGILVDGPEAALKGMIEGDPLSLFGGLVLTNFSIERWRAEALVSHRSEGSKRILDVVVAPSFTHDARDILRRKNGACRMLVNAELHERVLLMHTCRRMRQVRGGFLMQGNYEYLLDFSDPELEVHGSALDENEMDLALAWAICSRSNSNTITIVKEGVLLGNGVGQQSRVDAAKLAVSRAQQRGHDLAGAVACSDSFFPFEDGALVLADAGITTIFATRGSVRDGEVATALEKRGVTFVTLPDTKARGFFGH